MVLDPFTIISAITLVNTLFRVFRSITRWLKNRDPLFKENNRMMKILKAYFDRNTVSNERLPSHIQAMIMTLQQRKLEWSEAPGALEAENEAEEIGRYGDVGYTTEYDLSDNSDEDEDSFPADSDDDEENADDDDDEENDSSDDDVSIYSSDEDDDDSD